MFPSLVKIVDECISIKWAAGEHMFLCLDIADLSIQTVYTTGTTHDLVYVFVHGCWLCCIPEEISSKSTTNCKPTRC